MKFKNIDIGVMIQNKKSGEVYAVEYYDGDGFCLSDKFIDIESRLTSVILPIDSKLFRKYKGD